MDAEMKGKLRQLLVKHEGYKQFPYKDSVGKITIGIGRNLSDRALETTIIDEMFENDIDYFFKFLSDKLYWFNQLNDNRKIAIIDMCFNLGTIKFLTFKKMFLCLECHDWEGAYNQIISSDYAKEVGKRAQDIANIILKGIIEM